MWQGYDLHVLVHDLHLKLMFSGLLQNVCLNEG